MKNQVIIIFLLTLSIASCEPESPSPFQIPEDALVFDIDLESQELYTLTLGQIGTEDRLHIVKQASEYNLSQLITDSELINHYQFRSKAGFRGEETVAIKHCLSAGGTDCVKDIYTVLNLRVN